MIRPQVFLSGIFAAVMAAPAMAHVEPSAHTHTGEFNWLAACLAAASIISLVVLHRRKAVSRS